jgi:hypothetical protein
MIRQRRPGTIPARAQMPQEIEMLAVFLGQLEEQRACGLGGHEYGRGVFGILNLIGGKSTQWGKKINRI